ASHEPPNGEAVVSSRAHVRGTALTRTFFFQAEDGIRDKLDWSSDVCSSDLGHLGKIEAGVAKIGLQRDRGFADIDNAHADWLSVHLQNPGTGARHRSPARGSENLTVAGRLNLWNLRGLDHPLPLGHVRLHIGG